MRTLLVGCGAIGGVTAAELSRAGHDVTVVTGNDGIRDAIAERGLSVRGLDGQTFTARLPRPPVVRAAELAGQRFDLCLLATKTTTLEEAAREAAPLLTADAPVVCMQNGLPEDRVAAVVGAERVVGCVVGWGALLLGPGQAARTSKGSFQLGLLPGGREAALAQAESLLGGGPFTARRVPDLASVRWSKLAINCATSTLGAVGGDTLGRLLQHRFVRRLALELWAEISAVAAAAGVRMAKVAGAVDIAQLSITEAERRLRIGSPSLLYKHSLLYAIGLKFRRMRSSMLVTLERGRRPEIDWLNGEVARRGARLGVPTPINAALVETINAIAGRRERSSLALLRAFHDRHVGAGPLALPAAPLAAPGREPPARPSAPPPAA